MDTTQALHALGAHHTLLTDTEKQDLNDKGFVLLRGTIGTVWLTALRNRYEELCAKEGEHAGIEVHQEEGARRLSDLPNKGAVFDRVYTQPKVLAAVHHVIGRGFKLSSLKGRDALPGHGQQGLHADWGKDYDGRFHVCNSIWLLDDFSRENGCTRLVPGSHRGQNPRNVGIDPLAPHPEEEHLIARAAPCTATSPRGSIPSSSTRPSTSASPPGSGSPPRPATSSTSTCAERPLSTGAQPAWPALPRENRHQSSAG